MDELIARLVADVGIDRVTAEKAVGIILDFLVKEGPADKVQPLLAKLPGAEAVMQKAASENGAGGMMAGAMGGAMGGVMGAGMRMMSAGLSMGQVQSVTRAVIAYTREKAGEDAVGEIVAAIPGLAQFV
jgi:predicted lipid-binding transport protein (Tim44 family)